MSRELLFYSDFPFGYHNREAEEKMARFARRGYEVHYVEQLGIRNPHPRHLLRVARTITTRSASEVSETPFDVVSPRLMPPRRAPLVDRVNKRWLAHQLRSRLRDPASAILWIRYPTPELVPFVESSGADLVVYESVDDHMGAPGMGKRMRRVFREAEQRILSVAGVVFASSEPIAARLSELHPNVVLTPNAVDIDAFSEVANEPRSPRTAIYAGAANFRFDAELVAQVAARLDGWTFILAGTVDRAVRRRLERLPNIQLTGLLAPDAIPAALARAGVCLMPYRLDPFCDALFPIKLVEYLASGRPVVATPIRAARGFADVVALADGPEDFAAAIQRSSREDSFEARRTRIERVRPFSWEQRIDQMEAAITSALALRRSPA